jgi:hypothetical protein
MTYGVSPCFVRHLGKEIGLLTRVWISILAATSCSQQAFVWHVYSVLKPERVAVQRTHGALGSDLSLGDGRRSSRKPALRMFEWRRRWRGIV